MKKLSILFAALAILLSDAMCAVVAYKFCDALWSIKYGGTSFPADVAFLYAIPFAAAIAVCVILAIVFRKKAK